MGTHRPDLPGLRLPGLHRPPGAGRPDRLHARTRTATDRTSVLVDLAAARLLEAKVLLPGPSLLDRLVTGVRESAAQQLYAELAALPDPDTRTSRLERLRRGPASVTAAGLLGALDRVEQVRALGASRLNLTGIPGG